MAFRGTLAPGSPAPRRRCGPTGLRWSVPVIMLLNQQVPAQAGDAQGVLPVPDPRTWSEGHTRQAVPPSWGGGAQSSRGRIRSKNRRRLASEGKVRLLLDVTLVFVGGSDRCPHGGEERESGVSAGVGSGRGQRSGAAPRGLGPCITGDAGRRDSGWTFVES